MFEDKTVKLCFGQRICALLLNRVLRRDNHKPAAEGESFSVNRNLAFLHSLKQGRLGLGRCAVDFIGQ